MIQCSVLPFPCCFIRAKCFHSHLYRCSQLHHNAGRDIYKTCPCFEQFILFHLKLEEAPSPMGKYHEGPLRFGYPISLHLKSKPLGQLCKPSSSYSCQKNYDSIQFPHAVSSQKTSSDLCSSSLNTALGFGLKKQNSLILNLVHSPSSQPRLQAGSCPCYLSLKSQLHSCNCFCLNSRAGKSYGPVKLIIY